MANQVMVTQYKAPLWSNDDGKTKRGRPLVLLDSFELQLINKFLQKKIKRHCWITNIKNYNANLLDKVANSYISETTLLLKKLELIDVIEDEHIFELDRVNHNLNRIFSESGWRSIRFEIRQIKKRNKQIRVEISKDLFAQLEMIKKNEKLDNINSTLEFLIDSYIDAANELNVKDEN